MSQDSSRRRHTLCSTPYEVFKKSSREWSQRGLLLIPNNSDNIFFSFLTPKYYMYFTIYSIRTLYVIVNFEYDTLYIYITVFPDLTEIINSYCVVSSFLFGFYIYLVKFFLSLVCMDSSPLMMSIYTLSRDSWGLRFCCFL